MCCEGDAVRQAERARGAPGAARRALYPTDVGRRKLEQADEHLAIIGGDHEAVAERDAGWVVAERLVRPGAGALPRDARTARVEQRRVLLPEDTWTGGAGARDPEGEVLLRIEVHRALRSAGVADELVSDGAVGRD